MQGFTWLSNIAFHLWLIWLETLKTLSEVAVLLDWNLSKCPFLGQIVNLDLLLCT